MTTVLKLGGSVVTAKDEPETVDSAALADTAAALADATDATNDADIVLVHGGGSFGHPYAAEHGVSPTDGTRDANAVREIHGAMRRLNERVCAALGEHDVPAVPHHPHSAAYRGGDEALALPADAVNAKLEEGFLPVLHGDVVTHVGAGATVVSGDDLVVTLARGLDADRVGVCSTVPGVLDDDGDVIPEITDYDDVAAVLGGSDATDVTGGMAGKVRALLALDAPVSLFGPDALGAFLAGDEPGTLVD